MSQRTFLLVPGTRIEVPPDFRRLYNHELAKKPHDPGHQPMVVWLVFVEKGGLGRLYGFQTKPPVGQPCDHALVMFVPILEGGETIVIDWVSYNCACAKQVSAIAAPVSSGSKREYMAPDHDGGYDDY